MSHFQPKNEVKKVPFFEDVDSSDGWEGHRTRKTIKQLMTEISSNLSLLNCGVTQFREGKFGDRFGFQILFSTQTEDGKMIPNRMDIAALPLKRYNSTKEDNTKRMALYMTAQAIKGMYFLNVLSSAWIPFMSFMLTDKNETLGDMWIQNSKLALLMPPNDKNFVIDADVKEL
jgi:hypothetical protein